MNQHSVISQNKFIAFSAIAIAATLTAAFSTPANNAVQQPIARIAPTSFGVTAMQLMSDNSGTATIQLDQFTLQVSFDYTKFEDSYGVPGSEFDSAAIDVLTINKVTDSTGNQVSDFTDFNDHLNINALLVNHMISKKLV